MTIGAIVLDVGLIIGALIIAGVCFSDSIKRGIIVLFINLIVVGCVICFQFWFYRNTATGSRALKTQESELQNGITRVVKVYDINGKVIQEYEGKFDITYDDSRILFDDENGRRHTIYYSTGTVIIDEK